MLSPVFAPRCPEDADADTTPSKLKGTAPTLLPPLPILGRVSSRLVSADDLSDAELWQRRGGEAVADGSWGEFRGVDTTMLVLSIVVGGG